MRYDFLKAFSQTNGKHVVFMQFFTGQPAENHLAEIRVCTRADEQINLIFAVLLYIMEQS